MGAVNLPDIEALIADSEGDPRSRNWLEKWSEDHAEEVEWLREFYAKGRRAGLSKSKLQRVAENTLPDLPRMGYKAFCDALDAPRP